MNTVTKYTVSDAALLYKKSRATLYKDIKNGILSRDNDGLIDFSELLRVYGEPYEKKSKKRIDTYPIHTVNTHEYNEEYMHNTVKELENQIRFLKEQLHKAETREEKANQRIDTLLTLIEMKKPVFSEDKDTIKETVTEPSVKDNSAKKYHVPNVEEEEIPKRSFLHRFFLPNG
ncbi:plasmid replication DNA-binding protein [Acinetobacter stercoris]|uniref:DNA-binding protein n=1 Tax=Acinetobacter stercoris TaxID=2126983 RepID=A0A2U3N391_9GAMM|nr:plasmid replication DNA-binding protein [Acinetobacter stercoris]SPL72103.1 hypothetical protein KPC_3281 [Acinetobacter stercoris]